MTRSLLLLCVCFSTSSLASELSEENIEHLYIDIHRNNSNCSISSAVIAIAPKEISDGINCVIAKGKTEGKEWGYIVMKSESSVIPQTNSERTVSEIKTKYENIWLFSYVKK